MRNFATVSLCGKGVEARRAYVDDDLLFRYEHVLRALNLTEEDYPLSRILENNQHTFQADYTTDTEVCIRESEVYKMCLFAVLNQKVAHADLAQFVDTIVDYLVPSLLGNMQVEHGKRSPLADCNPLKELDRDCSYRVNADGTLKKLEAGWFLHAGMGDAAN